MFLFSSYYLAANLQLNNNSIKQIVRNIENYSILAILIVYFTDDNGVYHPLEEFITSPSFSQSRLRYWIVISFNPSPQTQVFSEARDQYCPLFVNSINKQCRADALKRIAIQQYYDAIIEIGKGYDHRTYRVRHTFHPFDHSRPADKGECDDCHQQTDTKSRIYVS